MKSVHPFSLPGRWLSLLLISCLTPLLSQADTPALTNLSSRAFVGTGDNVLIAGLVVGGTAQQKLLIRAVGPTLSTLGVSAPLANPLLTLYKSDGSVLASNDNWSDATNAAEIASTASKLGAFALPVGSKDSALLVTLSPGAYTAIVSGVNNTTGIALVEVYLSDTTQTVAFNMAQTLSDGAQRSTLAFDGLALLTGNLYSQSFFPPGKVADYTGFQFLRDNDPDNMGHNTSFLTRIANNVLSILSDDQLAQLKALASAQAPAIQAYALERYPLMQAFRRLADASLPSGTTGLNLSTIKASSHDLYLLDGQISYDRAVLYASILNKLNATQRAHLDAMKGKGWSQWPDIPDAQVKAKTQGLSTADAEAVMTYAGDLFSWYAGSLEADVYFCPERHGTYFGSFYMKDAPAVGHEGYSIDEQLTATAGAALCDSSKGYVTTTQANQVSNLVEIQRANLYSSGTSSIIGIRLQIATLLRSLLNGTAPSDALRTQILSLSGTYGDLDGENNYHYATAFAALNQSLSTDQKSRLVSLRKSILSGSYADGTTYDFTTCTTPFLYGDVISSLSTLTPYVGNTDYLFN